MIVAICDLVQVVTPTHSLFSLLLCCKQLKKVKCNIHLMHQITNGNNNAKEFHKKKKKLKLIMLRPQKCNIPEFWDRH